MEDVHSMRPAVAGELLEVTERAKLPGQYELVWVGVHTVPTVFALAPAFHANAPQWSCNSADRRAGPGLWPSAGGDGSAM
jgi:hypothetical protein